MLSRLPFRNTHLYSGTRVSTTSSRCDRQSHQVYRLTLRSAFDDNTTLVRSPHQSQKGILKESDERLLKDLIITIYYSSPEHLNLVSSNKVISENIYFQDACYYC